MRRYSFFGALFATTSIASLMCNAANAQITTDGSTATTCNGGGCAGATGNVDIDGGTVVGGNQFHNFSEFNVSQDAAVYFNYSGAESIANVIARVTGTDISNIDGQLGVSISEADLYLINPNGVVFGDGATTDLSGSLIISTADQLIFNNGDVLFADGRSGSIFSAASPEAFGFLDADIGDIGLDGRVTMWADGKDDRFLGLYGGEVTLQGIGDSNETRHTLHHADLRIRTAGGAGNLDIAGDRSRDSVGQYGAIIGDSGAIQLSRFGDTATSAESDIAILLDAATIDLTDTQIYQFNSKGGFKPADISLTADQTTLTNSSLRAYAFYGNAGDIDISTQTFAADNSVIRTDTDGRDESGVGGDININATQNFLLENGARLLARTRTNGDNGAITLSSPNITLQSGSWIGAETFASGNGQALTISGSGNLTLLGESKIQTDSQTNATGNGGDLNVTMGGDIVIDGLSSIESDTDGTGRGGNLNITAQNVLLSDGGVLQTDVYHDFSADVTGVDAQGGDITINADAVTLVDGGSIVSRVATALFETVGNSYNPAQFDGKGGNITVNADTLTLYSNDGGDASFIDSGTHADGDGGSIFVNVDTLTMSDGAIIAASSSFGTDQATGLGGNIVVNAADVSMNGAAAFYVSTNTSGNGGSLTINATNNFMANENVELSAITDGSGQAGSIAFKGGDFVLDGDTVVQTSTRSNGAGGDIDVEATSLSIRNGSFLNAGTGQFILDENGNPVEVTTIDGFDPSQSTARGGDISIDVDRLEISGKNSGGFSSFVASKTFANGRAGNITIEAGQLFVTDNGVITTTSEFDDDIATGQAGSVTVTAGSIELDSGVIEASTRNSGSGGDIVVTATGDIDISNGGGVTSLTQRSGTSGDITINAAELDMIGQSGLTSRLDTSTFGNGNAGGITVNVNTLNMTDQANISSNSSGGNGSNSDVGVSGTGGSIVINADDVNLTDSIIDVVTNTVGDAGSLTVNAENTINLNGESNLFAVTRSTGAAGDVTLNGGATTLTDTAFIATQSLAEGSGGTIHITGNSLTLSTSAGQDVSLRADAEDSGRAGDIIVDVSSMNMSNARISSTAASGSDGGGNIDITATQLSIENSVVSSEANGNADAGGVRVAGDAFLLRSARLTAESESGSVGNIVVVSDRQFEAISSTLSASTVNGTFASSDSGITVSSAGDLTLDGATILSSSISSQAGTVSISAGDVFNIENGTNIATNSGGAQAGAINLGVGAAEVLIIRDSAITTNGPAGVEVSTGGEITVTSLESTPLGGVLLFNSTLQALGSGNGALLSVDRSGFLLADSDSTIDVSGTVDIPVTDLSGEQQELDRSYLQAAETLSSQCAAQKMGDASALSLNDQMGLATQRNIKPNPLTRPELFFDDKQAVSLQISRVNNFGGADCG